MIKWEAKLVESSAQKVEAILNNLGAQGWEVVAAYEFSPNNLRVLVKRPASSDETFMAGIDS